MELPLLKIRNNHNICYLNSLLQSLFSLTNFNKLLLHSFPNEEYSKLIKIISLVKDNTTIIPKGFMPLFIEKKMINKHQDSDEVLIKFIQGQSKEIQKEFENIVNKIIKCYCGHRIESTEEHSQIYLDPAESLEESFKKFMSLELLEGYKCDKCNKINSSYSLHYINKPAHNLCIVLRNYFKKQRIKICFKLKIKGILFHLRSIIIHHGNQYSGHYVSITKKKDKWFLCDDENIREINELKSIVGAYILFYSSDKSISESESEE